MEKAQHRLDFFDSLRAIPFWEWRGFSFFYTPVFFCLPTSFLEKLLDMAFLFLYYKHMLRN